MCSGWAESSSRPASGGPRPIGAAVGSHLAPIALPRLPAVFLVPIILSSSIGEGLSPDRSQLRLVPWPLPREGDVLAMSWRRRGPNPRPRDPTARPPHTATPAGRCGHCARPRCLRCSRNPFLVPLAAAAPRDTGMDRAHVLPYTMCSNLSSVQEVPPPHCSTPRHGHALIHPPFECRR